MANITIVLESSTRPSSVATHLVGEYPSANPSTNMCMAWETAVMKTGTKNPLLAVIHSKLHTIIAQAARCDQNKLVDVPFIVPRIQVTQTPTTPAFGICISSATEPRLPLSALVPGTVSLVVDLGRVRDATFYVGRNEICRAAWVALLQTKTSVWLQAITDGERSITPKTEAAKWLEISLRENKTLLKFGPTPIVCRRCAPIVTMNDDSTVTVLNQVEVSKYLKSYLHI
jgi:hypothetical protein